MTKMQERLRPPSSACRAVVRGLPCILVIKKTALASDLITQLIFKHLEQNLAASKAHFWLTWPPQRPNFKCSSRTKFSTARKTSPSTQKTSPSTQQTNPSTQGQIQAPNDKSKHPADKSKHPKDNSKHPADKSRHQAPKNKKNRFSIIF